MFALRHTSNIRSDKTQTAVSKRRGRRVRSALPLLAVLGAFLLAACGGTAATATVTDNGGGAAATAVVTDNGGGGAGASANVAGNGAVQIAEDAAPNFQLTLFETENHAKGELLTLIDLAGKPVVLNFWFPSCPPCRAELPDFEASFQAHKDEVAFIGIQQLGLDSIQEGQDFINEIGVTYAVGPDEANIVPDYKIIGFPTTVFLNRDLSIEKKWTGALNGEKLEELIQELLQ